MFENIFIILAIVIVLIALYRCLRDLWLRKLLEQKKKAKRTRKPMVLKPKSERDCCLCREEQGHQRIVKREPPEPWRMKKGRGGRKKQFSTAGFFCSNWSGDYYRIIDERIHALVANGSHGTQEVIQDLKCQACGKKLTARRGTILYRLKTHSGLVEKIVWLLALGIDASALEEVFGVRENTISTWLCRSGMQGKKLHERFLVELELVHVQIGELWTNVKNSGQDLWLWGVSDVKTKLVPVLQVGARNQAMAFSVVHELRGRLSAGCVPVFSTDGLKHYFYALTAHFGQWEKGEGKKPAWILLSEFV